MNSVKASTNNPSTLASIILWLFILISILFWTEVNAQSSENGRRITPILSLLLFDDPEFSIESVAVSEGDSGVKTLNLTVRLSSFVESSVDYIYPGGATATEGSDYNRPAAGTLIFEDGETQATIEFQIIGDTVPEANEFFTVELVNPEGAELSSNSISVITIVDEDGVFNDTGVNVGAEANTGNNISCTTTTTALEQQDCANGRDALARTGRLAKLGTGPSGFDYTKLAINGAPLAIQTRAYSVSGSEAAGTQWACVRDNHTGLVWEVKEASGVHAYTTTYRWGGLTAIGINNNNRQGDYFSDWNVLVNSANNNARCGVSDWRVADIKSLSTLVNYSRPDGTSANVEFFPFIDEDHWSASPFNNDTNAAYSISFGTGTDRDLARSQERSVRLVSGTRLESIGHATAIAVDDQEVFSYIDNTTPNSRYIVSSNNVTVVDSITGLMWQRCVVGLSGANCGSGEVMRSDWGTAVAAAQSNTAGGFNDWRLPNIQELISLIALDRQQPAINATIFPNPSGSEHWSSTPALNTSSISSAWVGEPDSISSTGSRFSNGRVVRLVRDGQ